MQYKNLLTK